VAGLTSKQLFAGVFSRHAAAYQARVVLDGDPGAHRGRRQVLEAIAARPGQQVLDLACGPGTLTLPLAEAVGPDGRVVAVDLAEGMLELLRAAAPPQVEVLRMDIEDLRLPNAAFDAVACGHGLHLCPDLPRALGEARRVLREGGLFSASVPAPDEDPGPAELMGEAFAEVPSPSPEPDRAATIDTLADASRTRAALVAAGFRDPRVLAFEEAVRYESPEDLVEKAWGWWTCAWRLESLDPPAREAVKRRAVEVVRGKIGNGRIDLRGSTHVLEARR
jgi:ubiquinone/menaquinone biosynthesis C-methylase UbiE